jgi:hypothetical protein
MRDGHGRWRGARRRYCRRSGKVVKRRSEISHAIDMLFKKGIRDGSIAILL